LEEDFYRFLRGNKKLASSTSMNLITRLPRGWMDWSEDRLHEFYFEILDSNRHSSSSKHSAHYAIKYLCEFKGYKFDYKPPRVHHKRRQSIEPENVWKILDKIDNDRDLALILTHLYTGLRPTEILALKKEDLDLDKGTIIVKNTKTYQDRIVPIHKKPMMALRKYIAKRNDYCPSLFYSFREKTPMTLFAYRFALKKYCKKAGIRRVTPYQLRHTFATQFIENGGDVLILKSIMGHSNIKTTEGYVHENTRMIMKGYEKACPEF